MEFHPVSTVVECRQMHMRIYLAKDPSENTYGITAEASSAG